MLFRAIYKGQVVVSKMQRDVCSWDVRAQKCSAVKMCAYALNALAYNIARSYFIFERCLHEHFIFVRLQLRSSKMFWAIKFVQVFCSSAHLCSLLALRYIATPISNASGDQPNGGPTSTFGVTSGPRSLANLSAALNCAALRHKFDVFCSSVAIIYTN